MPASPFLQRNDLLELGDPRIQTSGCNCSQAFFGHGSIDLLSELSLLLFNVLYQLDVPLELLQEVLFDELSLTAQVSCLPTIDP